MPFRYRTATSMNGNSFPGCDILPSASALNTRDVCVAAAVDAVVVVVVLVLSSLVLIGPSGGCVI